MLLALRFLALVVAALPVIAQLPAEDETARCPAVPQNPNLTPLTDPFTFFGGRPVRTKEDWACRRAEISELIQRYGLGRLPTKKPIVKGELIKDAETMAVTGINITVTEGENTVSWTSNIALPTEGKGPFPAIIILAPTLGSLQLPKVPGVAEINFPNDRIGEQTNTQSRGTGLFYELYGKDHSAGALVAWAWGVSRLIDGLEQVQRELNIDAKRLGVTGCSRNGRGALVAGAFDTRIALTIPQESGAGGTSCWRIQDELKRRGTNTQTASQIVTENTWFSATFELYANRIPVLPYDQHLLSALVAPRALYSAENGNINWLGPEGAWGCQRAARTVWKALGAEENVGFGQTSQGSGHQHCIVPESQFAPIAAFIEKFLKRERVDTDSFFESEAEFPQYSDRDWIQWETPRLR